MLRFQLFSTRDIQEYQITYFIQTNTFYTFFRIIIHSTKNFNKKTITTKTHYVYVKINFFQKKFAMSKKLKFFSLFKHKKKKLISQNEKIKKKMLRV